MVGGKLVGYLKGAWEIQLGTTYREQIQLVVRVGLDLRAYKL